MPNGGILIPRVDELLGRKGALDGDKLGRTEVGSGGGGGWSVVVSGEPRRRARRGGRGGSPARETWLQPAGTPASVSCNAGPPGAFTTEDGEAARLPSLSHALVAGALAEPRVTGARRRFPSLVR